MPRTLDPAAHALRRDEFVDVAQRLILARGYERMSVQDVIDAAGASKGAFYHYFRSKAALLTAVIDRLVDGGMARFMPAVFDEDRPALEKLRAFLGNAADYKAEQRELILGAIQNWMSDENAIVREHFRRELVVRLEPMLTAIVRQGVAEGSFRTDAPEATGRVLISLWQGMSDDITELFFGLDAGTITFEHLARRLAAYADAFERILGAQPGVVRLADPALLRQWQQWQRSYREGHA